MDAMTDISKLLNAIRRPRILIRAARAGLTEYRRERDLRRLLRNAKDRAGGKTLDSLLAEESRLETNRTTGEATYSIQRHVAILTALIAEARHAAGARKLA